MAATPNFPIFRSVASTRLVGPEGDQWEEEVDTTEKVGAVKLLQPQMVNEGNGIDDRGTYKCLAVIPRGMPKLAAMQGLAETLRARFTRDCHHEYDCCGCQHASVSVRKTRRNRVLSLRYTLYRNY